METSWVAHIQQASYAESVLVVPRPVRGLVALDSGIKYRVSLGAQRVYELAPGSTLAVTAENLHLCLSNSNLKMTGTIYTAC